MALKLFKGLAESVMRSMTDACPLNLNHEAWKVRTG